MSLSLPSSTLTSSSSSRATRAASGVGPRRLPVGARRALVPQRRNRSTTTSTPTSTSSSTTTTSALPAFVLSAATTFEPRLSPAVAVSAAVAVIPPIIYWLRVATSVRKRLESEERERKEAEEKEALRLERLRRLKGE